MTLDTALTVRNAAALKQALLDAFEEGDEIALTLADDQPADLCGLQLIESARRHAQAVGKRLSLAQPAAAHRALLTDAGFLTDAAPETLRFWLHEGTAQ